MARRTILAAALCALAAGLTAVPASGHAGNPSYESLVRSVTPSINGFSVEVLNGDDRLEVINAGTSSITIDGYSKEPYLRLDPDGTVAVNLRSPAYYLNQDRLSGTKVPDSADPKAPPQWKVVERSGRYEFHDHRMHWMSTSIPQQVSDRSKRTKIVDWHVPLRAQGTTGEISGELFWRGSSGGAPLGAIFGLVAIVLLGGLSVVVVRRRRRAAAGGVGDRAGGDTAGATPHKPRGEAW